MAAGDSVDPGRWQTMADGLLDQVGARFARVEARSHARELVWGLLAGLPRKNCWILAEQDGHDTPDRLQHLLGRASWDTDGVRDDLRDYVAEHLGDSDGVLVVDETGDLKKGVATVGQRQYTSTAGRIQNAQVAVYLTYAGPNGHALIDRELYLPRSWTQDRQRRAAAGAPDDVEFATKPALALDMITRALEAGTPAGWVAAIGCHRRVPTTAGLQRADTVAAGLPRGAWARLSAGEGAKGAPPLRLGPDRSDQHRVRLRRWLPWRRWTLPAMLAYALLAAITAAERDDHPPTSGLIALSCNEVCRLLSALILRPARASLDPEAGPAGDGTTNTAPAPATTAAEQPPKEDLSIYGRSISRSDDPGERAAPFSITAMAAEFARSA